MFFSKKSGHLLAPTDGRLLSLASVSDEAFASGLLGVGFAANLQSKRLNDIFRQMDARKA